jgi:hypothetical protein
MTLRDVLLVIGTLPLLGVVALRLAAEVGLSSATPPSDALPAALGAFAVAFVLYVALTLRSIARATREILARETEAAGAAEVRRQAKAAVSDFAIHLDRTSEVDLRDAGDDDDDRAVDEGVEEPRVPEAVVRERKRLIGEVGSLLTRIPSARGR